MKLKRILTLTAAAALTTALLTGCPWEQDDAASSEPSSSSSRPSHDSDSGGDDSSAPPEQEETGPGYVEVKDEAGKVTKYEVSNENGLRTWAQAVEKNPALDCTLTADFTVQGDWTPVGKNSENKQYQGTFDGGGHTIYDLKVMDEENAPISCFGLFSYIGENGKVKNLNLVNVTVNVPGGGDVGGVAGINNGTITGCTVSGSVTGLDSVGGIAGWNLKGTITGCVASCIVLATSDDLYSTCNAGGVAGKNGSNAVAGSITGCCFTDGSVTGKDENITRAGGIVGYNANGLITDCYWQAGTDGSPSAGVGEGDNEDNCHKVTGDWKDAIEAMNDAIAAWNTANPENHCNVTYTLGAGGKPAWGSGTTLQAVLKMFGL